MDTTQASRPTRTVGLLLAAGLGTRFDAAAPGRKLDALIDGVPVAVRALRNLMAAVDTVIVATRSLDTAIARAARQAGAQVVVAADAALGMGHSLAASAAALESHQATHGHAPPHPRARTLVVALADMPWVTPETIRSLVSVSAEFDCIAQPVYDAQPGHPVVFPARYIDALKRLQGDVGARDVLRANAANVRRVTVSDSGVARDVDSPADLGASG